MNYFNFSLGRTLACGMLAMMSLASGQVLAEFPDRAIRLVVPFPPGGAGDTMARGVAQQMSNTLQQQIVVENKGGAGGTIAADAVAKSRPDGYTLLFGTMGTHAIAPAQYDNIAYDPIKDFTPVSRTHLNPRVLVVNAKVPVTSIAELIAYAKSKPGELTYGSAGAGSSGHLSGVLFANGAQVDLLHIPYKGSAQLLTDVLEGRVDMTFDSYAVYEAHIKSGSVRPLGVTSATRMGVLPDVPTIAESGLTGYDVSNWLGVFAPAGTPKETVDILNRSIVTAMQEPALRKQLIGLGIEPTSTAPDEFAELLRTDVAKWLAIVKDNVKQ